jgi:acyl-CoA hydrolase
MGSKNWRERYPHKLATASEALKVLGPGCCVFIGSGAAVPQLLMEELSKMSAQLADIRLVHILTLGLTPYADSECGQRLRHDTLFIGPDVREAVRQGRADYTPVFLSEIPRLFATRSINVDVALIQVSPPDEDGLCSYGVSVDVVKAAAENGAKLPAARRSVKTGRSECGQLGGGWGDGADGHR